ncbi:amidohydrolase [Primorskyibacter sp. S87]|uniref:amidohydrolase n=1 Tax=Primorskyibacter sp. S87 TaxID=3415126 RepID=UPI003C7A382E
MTPDTLARWVALRHDLHRHPDISGEEAATAARVLDILRKFNPDRILTAIGGHGVAAVYEGRGSGPTVAIRCELDALPIQELSASAHASTIPGKAHLCGHDGHMVMVLALAEALQDRPPKRGRVVLLFQPAEETGKGASAFRADSKFTGIAPDYVFALHNMPGLPLGHVELNRAAANCASRGMKIRLTGKTSHAAAPGDGLSPAGAMARLMPALAALGPGGVLDSEFALTTLTHAALGEPTFGVSPGSGELWVTLRTVANNRMERLMSEATALAEADAAAQGLGLSISYDDIFDACTNDATAVQILQAAALGAGAPVQLIDQPLKFSEDFGQFGKGAKTAMFWLGAGEDSPQLHNPDYDFPDVLIPTGTAIFLKALRALTD